MDDQGGRDLGRDQQRDFGDEPAPAWRTEPPDPLAPIDPNAPVSGHVASWDEPGRGSEAPEHDWTLAVERLYPVLVPGDTAGALLGDLDAAALAEIGVRAPLRPLLDPGPAGLLVKYVIAEEGFDVTVNAEHVRAWAIDATTLREASYANLARWVSTAAWSVETSGDRRLISSATGRWDASRILLTSERDSLTGTLAGEGRVLVGLPERHLLVAGALRPGDDEFAALLAEFVAEQAEGADEPIDSRLFELVGDQVVAFE